MNNNGHSDRRELLIFPLAAVVLVGWCAALVVGLITQNYTALTFTTPLMLALAGYVFGVNIVRRGGGNDG